MIIKNKLESRGKPGDEGRLKIAEALLKNPKFSFSSAEEEAQSMMSGNRKPLSARTFLRLLLASDGTKAEFLQLWNSFCDSGKFNMAKTLLSNYQDVDDKANAALKRDSGSEVFKKKRSLVDDIINLGNN